MTLTLVLPAPCAPINSNHREHFRTEAKRTAAWRARAQIAAIQAGKPQLDHAHVWAVVGYPTNRSYDAGNFYPTAKAALDGIVSAGVLVDDSNKFVVGPDLRPGPKAEGGVFTLTISLDDECCCVDCVARFGGAA